MDLPAEPSSRDISVIQDLTGNRIRSESFRPNYNWVKTVLWSIAAVFFLQDVAFSQTLSHGPVFGGVTDSDANIFVRTTVETSVALWYGTDPNLESYLV